MGGCQNRKWNGRLYGGSMTLLGEVGGAEGLVWDGGSTCVRRGADMGGMMW